MKTFLHTIVIKGNEVRQVIMSYIQNKISLKLKIKQNFNVFKNLYLNSNLYRKIPFRKRNSLKNAINKKLNFVPSDLLILTITF